MAGRPGFLGGPRQDSASEASDQRFDSTRSANEEGGFSAPGFDPVWGTLGPLAPPERDPWLAQPQEGEIEGTTIDVDVFGDGFQISGQLRTGQFDRLSDWLNMQTGFISVADASLVHLGLSGRPDTEHQKATLWVRLDQIVLVAERAAVQTTRPGAPVVQKQRRRVTIVAPGYNLRGSMHVHAFGSMKQFLETPDPHFLPITDVSVRWLSDENLVSCFPFALINREQLITIIDEASAPGGEGTQNEPQSEPDVPLHERSGAA